MNIYKFSFPVSGYVEININADNTEQACQIVEEHKKEICPRIPNMFLDVDFDNPILFVNENENVNEDKIQEIES